MSVFVWGYPHKTESRVLTGPSPTCAETTKKKDLKKKRFSGFWVDLRVWKLVFLWDINQRERIQGRNMSNPILCVQTHHTKGPYWSVAFRTEEKCKLAWLLLYYSLLHQVYTFTHDSYLEQIWYNCLIAGLKVSAANLGVQWC